MAPVHVVELTADEQTLFESIAWEGNDEWLRWDRDRQLAMFENARALTVSLIKRDAIPQVRLDSFTKPEMRIGGGGKSWMQIYEGNGTKGEDIFRDPNFRKFLWYFMKGPRLPKETIEGFCRIVHDELGTSGMVLKQACAFVRKEVRDHVGRGSEDEFMKLAFELDRPDLAEGVRHAAMSAIR